MALCPLEAVAPELIVCNALQRLYAYASRLLFRCACARQVCMHTDGSVYSTCLMCHACHATLQGRVKPKLNVSEAEAARRREAITGFGARGGIAADGQPAAAGPRVIPRQQDSFVVGVGRTRDAGQAAGDAAAGAGAAPAASGGAEAAPGSQNGSNRTAGSGQAGGRQRIPSFIPDRDDGSVGNVEDRFAVSCSAHATTQLRARPLQVAQATPAIWFLHAIYPPTACLPLTVPLISSSGGRGTESGHLRVIRSDGPRATATAGCRWHSSSGHKRRSGAATAKRARRRRRRPRRRHQPRLGVPGL